MLTATIPERQATGLGSLGRAVGMETSGSIKPSATMRDSRKAQTEKASLVKANEKIIYIYIHRTLIIAGLM